MNSVELGDRGGLGFLFLAGVAKRDCPVINGAGQYGDLFLFYGYAYYGRTHNYWISCLIWLVGPFVLTILFSLALWIFNRLGEVADKDARKQSAPTARPVFRRTF